MENISHHHEPAALAAVFSHDYLNGKALYLYRTGKIPSVAYMQDIDPYDAIAAFRKEYEEEIEDWHNEAVWNPDTKNFGFDNTFFVLKNDIIIQFGHNFVHMIHSMNDWDYVEKLAQLFAPFKRAEEL